MPAFDFVLAGRYRLVAPLGEGGMAAVYRGRDLRLNREVAVKVLREELTRDPEFLSRFRREAELVASMSHPHIVPVYDVGDEGGTHFIVMEYVRGRTLRETIEREGRIEAHGAVSIMLPVLDALGYAHGKGLIHRDVKPHNILLTPDGTPRLADFGIARLVDGSTTRTAAILGSAQYLSPEQSRGEDASPLSDIYACGVVLFEMLTGRPPFDGPNSLAIAHQHLHDHPPALGESLHGIAPGLEGAVQRALAKSPSERFGSTADFATALHGLDTAQETRVQPLAPSRQPPAPLPRAAIPAHPSHNQNFVVRRSARKSYVLAGVLAFAVAALAYMVSLPGLGGHLPSYPSAPYMLLPALVAAIAVLSWVNARSWVYTLDMNAAVVQWGLIGHHRLGVPMRQVVSLELKQSLIDRLLGVGTVELCARDPHGAERHLVMEDVPSPRRTYADLVRLVGGAAESSSVGLVLPGPDENATS